MIKKSVVCFLFIFLSFIFVCDSYCSQDQQGTNVSLSVNPVFYISAPTSINFNSINPGQSTPVRTVQIHCGTNNNKAWSINMKVLSEFTSGAETMPYDAFKWLGGTGGSGSWYLDEGYVKSTDVMIYSCGPNEYVTSPNEIILNLNFKIDVPGFQAAGEYTTTLQFTIFEN